MDNKNKIVFAVLILSLLVLLGIEINKGKQRRQRSLLGGAGGLGFTPEVIVLGKPYIFRSTNSGTSLELNSMSGYYSSSSSSGNDAGKCFVQGSPSSALAANYEAGVGALGQAVRSGAQYRMKYVDQYAFSDSENRINVGRSPPLNDFITVFTKLAGSSSGSALLNDDLVSMSVGGRTVSGTFAVVGDALTSGFNLNLISVSPPGELSHSNHRLGDSAVYSVENYQLTRFFMFKSLDFPQDVGRQVLVNEKVYLQPAHPSNGVGDGQTVGTSMHTALGVNEGGQWIIEQTTTPLAFELSGTSGAATVADFKLIPISNGAQPFDLFLNAPYSTFVYTSAPVKIEFTQLLTEDSVYPDASVSPTLCSSAAVYNLSKGSGINSSCNGACNTGMVPWAKGCEKVSGAIGTRALHVSSGLEVSTSEQTTDELICDCAVVAEGAAWP